jgi:heterodisulfide reductase subunit C
VCNDKSADDELWFCFICLVSSMTCPIAVLDWFELILTQSQVVVTEDK